MNLVEWVKNLFNEGIKFDDLSPLIFGILIGFILAVLIYVMFIFTSFKKNEKQAKKVNITLDDQEIALIVTNAKNKYLEETSAKLSAQKFTYIGELALEIISDIASKYYPKSKHPIFELTVEELFILNHYITDRIESMFSGVVLRKFKKMKISTVLNLLDLKKKYDESKVVKAANRAKLPQILKSTMAVLNVLNPVYWVKKVMLDAPLVIAMNKIALTTLEVVANETNKVYSKNVFVSDDTAITQTMQEIEAMLGKE